MKVQDIIVNKPYLAWDIKNPDKLSDESVLEHILNFGDWYDVQEFIKISSISKTAELFEHLRNKNRSNLSPEIEQYFNRYFQKYA